MLTTIKDTDVDILLTLSYDDLENYCFINKFTYDICKNDTRIQQKLGQIHKMVNNVLEKLQIKGGITLLPITINQPANTYMSIMDQHNINFLSHTNINIPKFNVNKITIAEYKGDVYLDIHIYGNITSAILKTKKLTINQVREILFNLFFDNLLKQ
jgi:hypothetical protein